MDITNFFDKTYCINLDRRPDRWKEFQTEIKKWGFSNVERYSAYDGKFLNKKKYKTNLSLGNLGLVLTNIDILNEAIKNDYEDILILEDDAVFTDEVKNFKSFMEQLPADWDMLYFGGNHTTHEGTPPPQKISDNIVKLHRTFTTHAVAIKKHMFQVVIDKIKDYQLPIDVHYSHLQLVYNIYCFTPIVARQRVGYSDIENGYRDYNNLIK